jgi:hypothetical protein
MPDLRVLGMPLFLRPQLLRNHTSANCMPNACRAIDKSIPHPMIDIHTTMPKGSSVKLHRTEGTYPKGKRVS